MTRTMVHPAFINVSVNNSMPRIKHGYCKYKASLLHLVNIVEFSIVFQIYENARTISYIERSKYHKNQYESTL